MLDNAHPIIVGPTGVAPALAIQLVTVSWTKASRGGPAAARRNQLPRAFLLHAHGGSFNVIDRHAFMEVAPGEFSRRLSRTGQAPTLPAQVDGLLLEERGGQLVVGFRWDGNIHGKPDRGHRRRVGALAPGESAQLRLNGRHSSDAHWYSQHTFNLAYGPRHDEHSFVSRPFTHVFCLEEILF